MTEKSQNKTKARGSKKIDNQDILEQFNKKRKLQNKVLKKIVENLEHQNE